MRHSILLAVLPLTLAACQQAPTDEVIVAEETAQAPADGRAPAATRMPGTIPAPTKPIEATIPVALHGNWGMVPADCASTRGDAKGLVKIAPTTLRFYESVGRLGTLEERSDTSIRADYAFTGEGMNWTRDVTLTVSNGGKTLTRVDRGGDEPGGPFTYTRCAA